MDRLRLDAAISCNGPVCALLGRGRDKSYHRPGSFVWGSRRRQSEQHLDLRWHDMDSEVSCKSTSPSVRGLSRFRPEHQCSDSFRRRKRWRRPEHYMAMVCGWGQLELGTSGYDAIASTARRCRYGLFACVRPPDCLWWTRQRDAAERHLAICTVSSAA